MQMIRAISKNTLMVIYKQSQKDLLDKVMQILNNEKYLCEFDIREVEIKKVYTSKEELIFLSTPELSKISAVKVDFEFKTKENEWIKISAVIDILIYEFKDLYVYVDNVWGISYEDFVEKYCK